MSASLSAATPAQLAFVDAVSKKLSFKITVSSWGRTPLEQAKAMLAKHGAAGGGSKGDAELHATYAADRSIDTLLALPRTEAAWAAWIAQYGLDLSRHLSGRAVDFSVRGLTSGQVTALQAAIEAVGGRALYEANPPHVHADLVRTGGKAAVVAAAVTSSTGIVLALLAGGAWIARSKGWI